jgi:hypothetical protein
MANRADQNQFVEDDADLNQRRSPGGTQQWQSGPQVIAPNAPPLIRPPVLNPQQQQQQQQQQQITPQQQVAQLQAQQLLMQQQHQAALATAADNLRAAEQEWDRLAALQQAWQLQPDTWPDPVMNNLIDILQNVSISMPVAAPPARVPEKQRVFSTDQERTAFMLQREANNLRSIVQAVQSITTIALAADQWVEDLRTAQAEAFAQLTEPLQQNVRTIKENETLINQMVNPILGSSKQTLDPPILAPAPHGNCCS